MSIAVPGVPDAAGPALPPRPHRQTAGRRRRPITGASAHRLGLVNRLVEGTDFESRGPGLRLAPFARTISRLTLHPAAIRAHAARRGRSLESDYAAAERLSYLDELMALEDADEGVRAFAEPPAPGLRLTAAGVAPPGVGPDRPRPPLGKGAAEGAAQEWLMTTEHHRREPPCGDQRSPRPAQAPRRRPFAFGASALAAAFALARQPRPPASSTPAAPTSRESASAAPTRLNLAQRVERHLPTRIRQLGRCSPTKATTAKLDDRATGSPGTSTCCRNSTSSTAERHGAPERHRPVRRRLRRHPATRARTRLPPASPATRATGVQHTVGRACAAAAPARLMDAFDASGAVDLGEVPVRAELGRRTVWERSLLAPASPARRLVRAGAAGSRRASPPRREGEGTVSARWARRLSLPRRSWPTALSLSAQYLFEMKAALLCPKAAPTSARSGVIQFRPPSPVPVRRPGASPPAARLRDGQAGR